MKKGLIVLACSMASAAFAQIGGGYLGPAVLSNGATGVGNRGGEQVDLRFYAGVMGVYNSGEQSISLDSKGNLVTLGALYGVAISLGAYGSHSWKTATLGLDYHGEFDEYSGGGANNMINQMLTLGYTKQVSRRIRFDARVTGGVFNNALGGLGFGPMYTSSQILQPSTLLFNTQTYFLQGGLNATYIQSPRTSYTVGGQGFEMWQQSSQLVGMQGYSLTGTVEHKLSKYTSVGFTYARQHYSYPGTFGQSDIDSGMLFVGTTFDRNWSFTLQGGVYHAEVSGLQSVTLSPVIAALLGQSASVQAFYVANYLPSGSASLTRKFKRGSLNFSFTRMVMPGNGIYLTSKSDSGMASYSYTGIRKVSLNVNGGYTSLASLGQGIPPYRAWFGGGGMTYSLPYKLHLTAQYSYFYNQIQTQAYNNTGNMVTVGLTFSPGTIPLSIW